MGFRAMRTDNIDVGIIALYLESSSGAQSLLLNMGLWGHEIYWLLNSWYYLYMAILLITFIIITLITPFILGDLKSHEAVWPKWSFPWVPRYITGIIDFYYRCDFCVIHFMGLTRCLIYINMPTIEDPAIIFSCKEAIHDLWLCLFIT